MKMKKFVTVLSLASVLPAFLLNQAPSVQAKSNEKIKSIRFIGMDAPKTVEEMAKVYTNAKVEVTYMNGKKVVSDLVYNKLFQTDHKVTDKKGQSYFAGTPLDVNGNPIIDKSVPGKEVPFLSDSPDSNDLLRPLDKKNPNKLDLITHYEYDTLDAAGNSAYGKIPASMSHTTLDQNPYTGKLEVKKIEKLNFASVNGPWITCNGSQSPWNTHLGSEEYEPNAYKFETNPMSDPTNVKAFASAFWGDASKANPYFYGFIPEITVEKSGDSSVKKHYSMGRLSFEMAKVMPDKRTAFYGDDGAYTMMFMYVADRKEDLSEGTLYAAKFHQTSDKDGGEGTLSWIPLGHATDNEIEGYIKNGIKFSDIFDVSSVSAPGYKLVKTNQGTEYLKLKKGMEKAAAFLESRRYGAYLGATNEFNKMEGLAVNPKTGKLFMALSNLQKGTEDSKGLDPNDDIKLPKIEAGGVYEISTGYAVDANGKEIKSAYAGTKMKALVVGEDLPTPDAYGNTANPNKIANPDNLSFSADMDTLFIGEDSGKHINNYLWAYNVKTKNLARILSTPAGAESTGLQVAEKMNGYTYVMSNFQHPGDELEKFNPIAFKRDDLIKEIDKNMGIDKVGYVGYLSGFPSEIK